MKLTRKQIWITVGGLVLILGAALAMIMPPVSRQFDSHTWVTCTNHSLRIAMVRDLQKKYKLIGMTRQQLFEILGNPDGSNSAPSATWDMGTTVGTDDNYFIVYFDGDKVTKVTNFEQ